MAMKAEGVVRREDEREQREEGEDRMAGDKVEAHCVWQGLLSFMGLGGSLQTVLHILVTSPNCQKRTNAGIRPELPITLEENPSPAGEVGLMKRWKKPTTINLGKRGQSGRPAIRESLARSQGLNNCLLGKMVVRWICAQIRGETTREIVLGGGVYRQREERSETKETPSGWESSGRWRRRVVKGWLRKGMKVEGGRTNPFHPLHVKEPLGREKRQVTAKRPGT